MLMRPSLRNNGVRTRLMTLVMDLVIMIMTTKTGMMMMKMIYDNNLKRKLLKFMSFLCVLNFNRLC